MDGLNLSELRLIADNAWEASAKLNTEVEIRDFLRNKVVSWVNIKRFDYEEMWQRIQEGRLSRFEAWRKTAPEVPYTLLCLRSRWQELKFWDDRGLLGIFTKEVGRNLDRVFLEQMVLADAPGGSAPEKKEYKRESEGWQYLYGGRSYAETFGEKLAIVVAGLEKVACWLDGRDGKQMAEYLRELAGLWSTRENDPEILDKRWENILLKEAKWGEYEIEAGNSALVAGDAGKQEVEILISLNDQRAKNYESSFRQLLERANKWRLKLGEESEMNYSLGVSKLVASYGSGVFWVTQAMGGVRMRLYYDVARTAVDKKIKLLKKVMKIENETIVREEILKALVSHEIGHSIGDYEKKRKQLPARSTWAGIIEEIKSQMVGYLLLEEGGRALVLAELAEETYALVEDTLKEGSAGEAYNLMARYVWAGLLDRGAIKIDKIKRAVEVVDAAMATEWLQEQGKFFLEQIYGAGLEAEKARDLAEDFVRKLKVRAQGEDIRMLVRWLKA